MTKDDKLKEHLAEQRHEDLLAVALGAFGFAGVSVALAYWQIQGWSTGLALLLLLVVFLAVLAPLYNRRKHAREKLIEQLNNEEQKAIPESSIKEPTNQDIMDELHKIQDEQKESESRSRVSAWLVLMSAGASFALASVLANRWREVAIGVAFFVVGFVFGCLRVSPWIICRRKRKTAINGKQTEQH